jgi:hypothetical protein
MLTHYGANQQMVNIHNKKAIEISHEQQGSDGPVYNFLYDLQSNSAMGGGQTYGRDKNPFPTLVDAHFCMAPYDLPMEMTDKDYEVRQMYANHEGDPR